MDSDCGKQPPRKSFGQRDGLLTARQIVADYDHLPDVRLLRALQTGREVLRKANMVEVTVGIDQHKKILTHKNARNRSPWHFKTMDDGTLYRPASENRKSKIVRPAQGPGAY